jgi:hypothetical protein
MDPMRAITLFGCLVIIVGACRKDDMPREDSSNGAVAVATAPAWSVPPTDSNLTCEPKVLRREDVLTLRMPAPHGPTMMAIGPDSTQYLVVFYGEGRPDRAQRKSLAPPEAFAKTPELNLDPKLVTAGPHVAGRDTNEALFTKPGGYRLIVGSDLETDGPRYAECVVQYDPGPASPRAP